MSRELAIDFSPVHRLKGERLPFLRVGKVMRAMGGIFETLLPGATAGDIVRFETIKHGTIFGEVVAPGIQVTKVMPYHSAEFIPVGTAVYLGRSGGTVEVSRSLLGRVVDFEGRPIDRGDFRHDEEAHVPVYGNYINPLDRPQINQPFDCGISVINGFTTLGKGQKVSIMAGSGVGKSVLMGMLARNAKSQVNVIALIGERGREVKEFIENDLGPEGLERSVVVVATSDQSPLVRIRAAHVATSIAEYFRDQGDDVLFMMDSVTRFAMAAREVSMLRGEPPGPKGYGPSVFAGLPKLMERMGRVDGKGSITGIYTVLVEGGDFDEPISDAVRSISDGHIALSRELAERNYYPAVDVLSSVSRVMGQVVSKEHRIVASYLRDLMSSYKDVEDLIKVGAYVEGSDPKADKAISIIEPLYELLQQTVTDSSGLDEMYDAMVELARVAEGSISEQLDE